MSNYGTPYDDSFRTLLTDCKRLIVPLVNEMFGENWQETENVELYAVEADQMLIYEVHMLWLTVLEQYKKDPQSMELDVTGRELVLQQ